VKIAFALIPEKGHVNPYVGPAQALVDAGHDVVIAASGDISEQMECAGLVFRRDLIAPVKLGPVKLGPVKLGPVKKEERVTRGAELVEVIRDAARLSQWIEQLLLGGLADQVTALRLWYEREDADAVVIDPLYYAAAIAAHQACLPWAAVSNSLNPVIPAEMDSALLRTVRRLDARRAEIFGAYGMQAAFSGCDVLSPFLTVAFATEEFVGKAPPGVNVVGPSFPLRRRGDETGLRDLPAGKPVIYASFGSQIYYWPEIFAKLLAAGRLLGVHMVFSMGDLAADPRWSAPLPDCDVYSYAPQLAILRQAAAFITHGGANSVMEAIAAGVPMLVSPMCNDQFHQAWFIAKAGIGCVENLTQAPVDRIAACLRSLLENGRPRRAMQAVSQSYRRNGAVTAAELIARL
jgi:UDP:flavonoid glycosyltransferase YjiC (YdhE family)